MTLLHGPIASVKVMWQGGCREQALNRHCILTSASSARLLGTSTRPTLKLLLLLRVSVRVFTIEVSRTPILVEGLFSTNLLPIHPTQIRWQGQMGMWILLS